MSREIRVVVLAAASEIAKKFIWSLAKGEVFGPNCLIYINLLDDRAMMDDLSEVSDELAESDLPLLRGVLITYKAKTAFKDVDAVFWPH
jgi:malate dehydrogenase